ncbi:MAG: hypothetical protein AB7P04_13170 [Bacteriovoracia bacterium]
MKATLIYWLIFAVFSSPAHAGLALPPVTYVDEPRYEDLVIERSSLHRVARVRDVQRKCAIQWAVSQWSKLAGASQISTATAVEFAFVPLLAPDRGFKVIRDYPAFSLDQAIPSRTEEFTVSLKPTEEKDGEIVTVFEYRADKGAIRMVPAKEGVAWVPYLIYDTQAGSPLYDRFGRAISEAVPYATNLFIRHGKNLLNKEAIFSLVNEKTKARIKFTLDFNPYKWCLGDELK